MTLEKEVAHRKRKPKGTNLCWKLENLHGQDKMSKARLELLQAKTLAGLNAVAC